jgi:hypothetical protein
MSPAKGRVTDYSRAGVVEHLRAFVERCRGRDDVIQQHDVGDIERVEFPPQI